MNPMREVRVDKVTLNIGAGEAGQKLENAKVLLDRITGRKPVTTNARVRNPTFRIKRGDPIGAKVTLRGKIALEVLGRALEAVGRKIKGSSFDAQGNFAFGIREYIDFPGIKYDPKLGIFGFDVCVTLKRPGERVRRRRRVRAERIGTSHVVTREEALEFARSKLGAEIVE